MEKLLAERRNIPLSDLRVGQRAVVSSIPHASVFIASKDPYKTQTHDLASLELTPGTVIKLEESGEFVRFRVVGHVRKMRKDLAKKILVELK